MPFVWHTLFHTQQSRSAADNNHTACVKKKEKYRERRHRVCGNPIPASPSPLSLSLSLPLSLFTFLPQLFHCSTMILQKHSVEEQQSPPSHYCVCSCISFLFGFSLVIHTIFCYRYLYLKPKTNMICLSSVLLDRKYEKHVQK